MPVLFLSYNFQDEEFVQRVNAYLCKQPGLTTKSWERDKQPRQFRKLLRSWIVESDVFVAFLGEEIGQTQQEEIDCFLDLAREQGDAPDSMASAIRVLLPRFSETNAELPPLSNYPTIDVTSYDEGEPSECSRKIAELVAGKWEPDDGLPVGYLFDYEKEIIAAYLHPKDTRWPDWLARGCPRLWPSVTRLEADTVSNPISEERIGARRSASDLIFVDAHVGGAPTAGQDVASHVTEQRLALPEAGPRKTLRYPVRDRLHVAVLVSGGIAPGINAVIAGIVERHYLYAQALTAMRHHRLHIFGYRDGFQGVLRNSRKELTPGEVRDSANRAGSMIGTSRMPSLMDRVNVEQRRNVIRQLIQCLGAHEIDILYIVGGDGSMKAAHAIWTIANQMHVTGQLGRALSVVAVPKTMDNDILWVWQSFGLLSAVNTANEFILQLHTEVSSNPRLCIMQLFGSDSGFVVAHAALASRVCDRALIPEVAFTMNELCSQFRRLLVERYDPAAGLSPYGLILMAETAIPTDVTDYLHRPDVGLDESEQNAIQEFLDNKRRVYGQTPDALRTGGLKIVSRVLQSSIQSMGTHYWPSFRVVTNEPRHLLRAIPPSVADVIFGQRLGILAVDNAMAGYTDFMISQWLTEYVLVPLSLVVLGRKRVPPEGIFWRSVEASTTLSN